MSITKKEDPLDPPLRWTTKFRNRRYSELLQDSARLLRSEQISKPLEVVIILVLYETLRTMAHLWRGILFWSPRKTSALICRAQCPTNTFKNRRHSALLQDSARLLRTVKTSKFLELLLFLDCTYRGPQWRKCGVVTYYGILKKDLHLSAERNVSQRPRLC
jgi:hypothetical protein